jgi:hypothetical protein
MRVDEWFKTLDRGARKNVLAAMYRVRDVAEGDVPSHRAIQDLKGAWQYLKPLLHALDDDHYELKRNEGDPG